MSRINNINNKSSSLTIDPGASGDSSTQFSINGTPEFVIGVDDTDDTFRIAQGSALGTNDTYIMSDVGECTLPLNPAFFAYPSSDLVDVTGDGTVYLMIFDSEQFDIGGNYDTSTGLFTAPATGKYMFTASLEMEDLTTSHTSVKIYFSGDPGQFRGYDDSFQYSQFVTGGIYVCNIRSQFEMTAADQVGFYVTIYNGTKVVDIASAAYKSFFSGCLIS